MDSDTTLSDALHRYAAALHAAWEHSSFPKEDMWTNSTSKAVVTEAGEGAYRLPTTRRPVRGADGVEVKVVDRREPQGAFALMLRASGNWRTFPPNNIDEAPLGEAVARASSDLCEVVRAMPALHERAYSAVGYKTYSIEEVRERIAAEAADPDSSPFSRDAYIQFVVEGHFARAIDAAGLDPARPGAFDRWDQAIEATLRSLNVLRTRTHWQYDVYALLNAPAVDDPGSVHLVSSTLGGEPVEVTIIPEGEAVDCRSLFPAVRREGLPDLCGSYH